STGSPPGSSRAARSGRPPAIQRDANAAGTQSYWQGCGSRIPARASRDHPDSGRAFAPRSVRLAVWTANAGAHDDDPPRAGRLVPLDTVARDAAPETTITVLAREPGTPRLVASLEDTGARRHGLDR